MALFKLILLLPLYAKLLPLQYTLDFFDIIHVTEI